MKQLFKKLVILLLFLQISFCIDFVQTSLLLVGVEQDKFGHFVAGKEITHVLEENFNFSPLDSFFALLWIAEVKEQIDIQTGSQRDPNDVAATILGWLFDRFMRWEIKF